MDELKFMAWTDEGMINVRRITFAGAVVYVMSDNDEHDGYEFQISPGKLRCFTGLKDKNGKEIYKGDIVRYNTGEVWGVNWNPRFAGFIYENKANKNLSVYQQNPGMHEVEIIGNIYENPELLAPTTNTKEKEE